jgi:hypothetical protein
MGDETQSSGSHQSDEGLPLGAPINIDPNSDVYELLKKND